MNARTTFLLTIIVAVSFLTIAAIPSVVVAQQRIIAACASDLITQCAGAKPGEGRIACIKTRFKEFSLPCQLAVTKSAAVRKACRADAKKNCADIKPGEGRIEVCIKDHFADLSDGCKKTISHAADKS
jgi:hypothetical protein